MSVTVAGIVFDNHEYDDRGDVLYLHVGAPAWDPAQTLETPEGHVVDYNEEGVVIGMVLLNARAYLERDGVVTVTMPPGRLVAAQIEPALVAV